MIGTQFTNNLKANRPTSLFKNPYEWAIARNLAYASIRDDIEKIIKQTNENSADVFINADNLLQNIRSKKINQYINGGNVIQEIDLSDTKQLNQILMNSNVFQTINYIKKENIIKQVANSIHFDVHSFLGNPFAIIEIIFDGIDFKYENIGCATITEVKNVMIGIYNKIQRNSKNRISIDNFEQFKYTVKGKKKNQTESDYFKFPNSFMGNPNIPVNQFENHNNLLFPITDFDAGFKDNGNREHLIIWLNLKKMKLYSPTIKKTDTQVLGKVFQDKNLLYHVTNNKFQPTDYGKMNSLMIHTNHIMPNNKLFN